MAELKLSSGSPDTLPSALASRHTSSCASLPSYFFLCGSNILKERDLQIISSFKVIS